MASTAPRRKKTSPSPQKKFTVTFGAYISNLRKLKGATARVQGIPEGVLRWCNFHRQPSGHQVIQRFTPGTAWPRRKTEVLGVKSEKCVTEDSEDDRGARMRSGCAFLTFFLVEKRHLSLNLVFWHLDISPLVPLYMNYSWWFQVREWGKTPNTMALYRLAWWMSLVRRSIEFGRRVV